MNFEKPDGTIDRGALIKGVGEYLSDAIKKALDEATRTCLNCEHFQPGPEDRSRETCGLNGLTPPPSIAARGCESYFDKVPF